MSESQILYLRELDNLVDDFTIKVRILHIWTMKDKKKTDDIFSRDMVIMDEEGSKCHASVQTKFFQRFHELLTVGSTVLIRRHTISENKSVFKIGKMRINFYYKTIVAVAPDFSGSLYGFSFNTFDSIISSSYSNEFSIDLIGEIVYVGPMIPSAGPTIQNRMEIRIQNLDALQIRVTLWGSFADKMAEFSNNSENRGRVIFIIQFARLNVYNGHVSVTSYFDVTKLFINTDIEEINNFRDLLVDKRGERDSSSSLTYQSGKLYSAEEDFLVNTEFKTIDEVLEPLEINKYVIVGTIYGIRQDFTWFYLSCKNCTHLATESKGVNTSNNGLDVRNKPPVYTCDSDSCVNMTIEVVPRYKIPIRVQDRTGTITVSLFYRDAFRFLKVTAVSILARYKELGLSTKLFPEELNSLIGLKLALKIESKHYNVKYNNNIYGVMKACVEKDIITELEIFFPKSQHSEIGDIDDEERVSKSGKEILSQSGDNITPSNTEDYGSTSKSKENATCSDNSLNLIIPKLEK